MQLSLSTWNSLNINDGSIYSSWIPTGQLANLSANPVTVNRAMEFPFLSTTVLNPHVFVIGVNIVAGQNINTYRETLKKYFNIMDTTRHTLVALDTADSNKPYYLTGFPIRIAPEGDSPNSFFITFAVEVPYWRLVTALTDNWSITASGQTHAVTNSGNISVKPSFAITPTTTKTGGLTYRRWVGIYNNFDYPFNYPFDITTESATGGGLDTAALTTAKMQADGDDFLVMVDGVFVDRWLQGMDTTTTQCWINLDLAAKKEAVLVTALSATAAVTTISLTQTRASRVFLETMAKVSNKVVLIESEAFTFTGVNLVTYQLTGVSVAQKDTAAADHAAAVTVRWIEHDIWILYGDSTLTAPDVNDDNKPMFELNSYNLSLIFTYFWDSSVKRPAAWIPAVLDTKSGLSYFYTATQNTFANSADYRATEMGIAMIGPESQYNSLIETGLIAWNFYHPAGLWSAIWSGKKYATGSFPAVVGLQSLQGDQTWYLEWTSEPLPAVLNSWEAFGPIDTSAGVNFLDYYQNVRFVMDGSLSPVPNEKAFIQFDTVTLSVNYTVGAGGLPTVLIGAETAINWFNFTLTNNTTGEYLKVQTPCLVTSGTLTIDCDNKKAYLQDGSRVNVTLSTEREGWLDLSSGSNTLQFDDTGTVAVTLVTTHRDRNL